MKALVFNPGSNSLKFEVIELAEAERSASEARKLVTASLDDIGRESKLSVFEGRELKRQEACNTRDMRNAVKLALEWLRKQTDSPCALEEMNFVGVRVVHGGVKYAGAIRVTDEVIRDIEAMEELAPLHNKSAVEILKVLKEDLPATQAMVTFDTAFHRTLPEVAWRYGIERETADRNKVRKYGFHGLSHRYMLEHYAVTVGKRPEECTLVTLHLESGCSAAAICRGKSVDTTMGMTPLEGLMMGSRSGSIDPAIVPYLMRRENKSADEILSLLNKKSGMIGIAGGSLDTRVLERREDEAAKLALAMFSYRVRLAVGAYLAALGDAEAVIFGGGIGEDSPWLRAAVCEGLKGFGIDFDATRNAGTKVGQARLTHPESRLQAWSMAVEEGMQVAYECATALRT